MPPEARLTHSGQHWHTAQANPPANCFKVRQFHCGEFCSPEVYPHLALAELLHVLKNITHLEQERTCVKIMKALDPRMNL